MGLDPAPQMANGHLHKYEFDFQHYMAKSNNALAKSVNHTYSFIDDISPLNDDGNFDKYKSQIYPCDLELNKEIICFKLASVLEVKIDIIGEMFNVSVL